MSNLPTQSPTPVEFGERGIIPKSMGDLMQFAEIAAKSKIAPAGMDTPEKIFVCCVFGAENGLSPMQAMRSIIVVNNMPSWRGDAALALALRSGQMLSYDSGFEGEGENRAAFFESMRSGWKAPKRTLFTAADAKRAGLWGKAGPWTQYPQRMMRYRALGFHLRDNYPDVLMGITITEEVADMPAAPRAVVNENNRPTPLLEDLEEATTETPANVADVIEHANEGV